MYLIYPDELQGTEINLNDTQLNPYKDIMQVMNPIYLINSMNTLPLTKKKNEPK